jgi:hypothetical protein
VYSIEDNSSEDNNHKSTSGGSIQVLDDDFLSDYRQKVPSTEYQSQTMKPMKVSTPLFNGNNRLL